MAFLSMNCAASFSIKRICILLILLVATSAGINDSYGARFVPLGFLPEGFSSYALGVSGDGATVVGTSVGPVGQEAFAWSSETGMYGLGDFASGDFNSYATSASYDGHYIVGTGTVGINTGQDGFRWNAANGLEAIGYFPNSPGQIQFSYTSAVSNDGTIVVGGGRSPSGNEAFRWTEGGGIEGLGQLAGAPVPNNGSGMATDISADGQVIVGYSGSVVTGEPFRWTVEEGMVGLGFLNGVIKNSQARAVSANGEVIIGYTSGEGGWQWTEDSGLMPVATTPSINKQLNPNDVSGDGSIIVGTRLVNGVGSAFIWNSLTGVESLEDFVSIDGWSLRSAEAISQDG